MGAAVGRAVGFSVGTSVDRDTVLSSTVTCTAQLFSASDAANFPVATHTSSGSQLCVVPSLHLIPLFPASFGASHSHSTSFGAFVGAGFGFSRQTLPESRLAWCCRVCWLFFSQQVPFLSGQANTT